MGAAHNARDFPMNTWVRGCARCVSAVHICARCVRGSAHVPGVLVTLTGIFSTCARNVCTFAECVHIPNQHICATDTKTSQSDVRRVGKLLCHKKFCAPSDDESAHNLHKCFAAWIGKVATLHTCAHRKVATFAHAQIGDFCRPGAGPKSATFAHVHTGANRRLLARRLF